LAVVPLLRALSEKTSSLQILSLVGPDGISREGWCEVSIDGARWLGSSPPSNIAARFLLDCERHEAACLRALATHDPDDAARAHELDPLRIARYARSEDIFRATGSCPAWIR
jgi:hypothetical protein